MSRKALILGAVLAAALTAATTASAQQVTVTVIQVRASNDGEKFTDPALGALGRKLERAYPFRNFKLVGSQSQTGNIGGTLNFALQGGMAMSLGLSGFAAPMVSLRVVVTRAAEQVMDSNLRVCSGKPLILSFPWNADRLIVVITPAVR
ncbi:MAG TPA: hypothetical protein VMX57_09455 [Planctomycetota bacterium]|nr:hypothetical protein [Planctomycetota bacterium]